jgi:hypothetical protein
MKVSELKQLIKEEIVKALAENEIKPTHRSNVDWYYVEEYSDYPGPKGRTVPNAKGFDNPKDYKGTELYIKKGTKGYVSGGKFEDEEGNDVEYKAEYFDKISGNQVNEANEYEYEDDYDEASNTIDSIISKELKDNFINSVEAIQSAVKAAGNKDIDRGDVYEYLLMMMEEDD